MFGGFRLLLSLMVVWYHLVDWQFSGPVAVFGFYVVSGYLMTKVINEVYCDGVAGFGRYIANRALRIYPMYWLALGLSGAAVAAFPGVVGELSTNYGVPGNLTSDLIIFGHQAYTPSLLPQAWSLAVELVYYLAMGALLSRHHMITLAWFVFGLEIVIFVALRGGYPFKWFFTSLAASSLPFATGAMIYHFRQKLPRIPTAGAAVAVAVIVLGGILMPRDFGKAGGIYLGLVFGAVAVAALSQRSKSRIDDALGDLAYPVFLFHYPAGAVAFELLGDKGIATGACALVITLLCSWAALLLADQPLRGARAILRRPIVRAAKPAS